MNLRLVEPVNPSQVHNESGMMYRVRPIGQESPKYQPLIQILQSQPCADFLNLGQWLLNYLKNTGFPCRAKDTLENPLYFMTDFSDPRPLQGLRIESDQGITELPDLFFLGFYTDWDDLAQSGIADIFGHEYAHLWFYLLNFDPGRLRGSKFHTCTAVTDAFTAFFEGFAEHLQIVTNDLGKGQEGAGEIWDHAMNVQAWLCYRDKQLRNHAVRNNRFVYQTALPAVEDFSTYADLHMAHITSSAFTPEKLKNGSQVIASEGAVASIFYHIYNSPVFKNQYCQDDFYRLFGTCRSKITPVQNLYLKIFHVLAKVDLYSPRLLTNFISCYGDCFLEEREELYRLFLELTHFTTVSHAGAQVFGNLYRIGRRGDIESFQQAYKEMTAFKEKTHSQVLAGHIALEGAVYPEIWVCGDKNIPTVPWKQDQVPYEFDLNTASEVDFLALKDVSLQEAKAMVRVREENHGFKSLEDFKAAFPHCFVG